MITAKHVNEHGKVALWEATDDGHRQVMLAAVDAAHALQADPDRWSLDAPSVSDKQTAAEQRVDLSATGTHDEPATAERSASEFGGESAQ